MEPVRLKFVRKARELSDSVLLKLPLPKTNPNSVSGLGVVTSLIFILALDYPLLASVFLAATLLLDWADGLIAKKYKMSSEEGYMADVMSDRLSEGIIFMPFFMPWFYLFALNNVLAIFSFVTKVHIILPLRHAFLVYFFFVYFI